MNHDDRSILQCRFRNVLSLESICDCIDRAIEKATHRCMAGINIRFECNMEWITETVEEYIMEKYDAVTARPLYLDDVIGYEVKFRW